MDPEGDLSKDRVISLIPNLGNEWRSSHIFFPVLIPPEDQRLMGHSRHSMVDGDAPGSAMSVWQCKGLCGPPLLGTTRSCYLPPNGAFSLAGSCL